MDFALTSKEQSDQRAVSLEAELSEVRSRGAESRAREAEAGAAIAENQMLRERNNELQVGVVDFAVVNCTTVIILRGCLAVYV